MLADPRLQPHNLQWQGRDVFLGSDPTLQRMRANPLVHQAALVAELPLHTPGIYTLVGGRQVGKSTLLKQLMARLLEEGIAPERMAYVTCEPFVDAEELRRVLSDLLAVIADGGRFCWLLLDEVTYVDGWDRIVKFLADAGTLDACFLMASGSDHLLIEDSLKRLPGRRGPLRDYHITGGFLPAINDFARSGEVTTATLRTYADWIRGDVLRLDRNERYLREVLTGVDRRQGSQVTWNSFAKELSIDHPKTVADYVGILERMDALLVVPALAEHQHGPAPKKARKVFFADPFIHRAVLAWLAGDDRLDSDARLQRDLEGVFAAHVARFADVYYIKARGEIDVAWLDRRKLQLVEVKWTSHLRPEELKEIRRRGSGLIAGRVHRSTNFEGIPVLPAAVVLLRLAFRSRAR
jgi:predicted AAA+ superfamily ATPase